MILKYFANPANAGDTALLSFGAVYYFYATWFISVWCFFAALLSGIVYLHFLSRGVPADSVHALAARSQRIEDAPT